MAESKAEKKSGLATASLVLGIIGAVLSFIPIINNIAFILGVLAFIFGIIPFFQKASRGKAIAGVILGILSIVITISMQNAVSDAIDDTSKELDKITGNSTEEVLKTDANVTLGDFTVTTSEYGLTNTKLVVTVKNITNEKKSFSFHIEAVDSDGKRIQEDYVYANDLSAGQTQEFETFNYVTSDKLELLKNATFKIVEASAY